MAARAADGKPHKRPRRLPQQHDAEDRHSDHLALLNALALNIHRLLRDEVQPGRQCQYGCKWLLVSKISAPETINLVRAWDPGVVFEQ